MTENGCQQCGENTCSGAGASSCTNCPDDMISAAGSTSDADCAYGENDRPIFHILLTFTQINLNLSNESDYDFMLYSLNIIRIRWPKPN